MNTALILSFTLLGVLCFVMTLSAAATAQSDSLIHTLQENHIFIAKLAGDNTVPPVNTNATGIAKFYANYNNNELYYEINLTNIHNDVARVDVHIGKETENGRTLATLYQSTVSLPSEICCRSAASQSERTKFFFNGTISIQSLEFGPLAGSKNIADLVRLFDGGNAYVEVYTYNPKSLSFLNGDSEIRGQIMPQASNYRTITKLQE